MSSGGEYYDSIWLEATLKNRIGGTAIHSISGSVAKCVLHFYFVNYFGFPVTIKAKADLSQKVTGLLFKRTSTSEVVVDVPDLARLANQPLDEALEAENPAPGTERIAVWVKSYEDKSAPGAPLKTPLTGPPIALQVTITP